MWERQERIGGQLRLASALPFKRTLPRLLDYYERALKRAGVAVRCGESVNADGIDADVVVHAVGPIWDKLDAITRDAMIPVLGAGDALMDLRNITGRVLVVGAGLAGAELAWALSLRAHQVFVVERDSDFDDDVNLIAKIVLSRELQNCGVQVAFGTEFIGVARRYGNWSKTTSRANSRSMPLFRQFGVPHRLRHRLFLACSISSSERAEARADCSKRPIAAIAWHRLSDALKRSPPLLGYSRTDQLRAPLCGGHGQLEPSLAIH